MTIQRSLTVLQADVADTVRPSITFGRRLAEALAWGNGKSSLRDIGEVVGCRVTEGSVADERATLFFGHTKKDVNDRLLDAALYAYHASVEWCVLTNMFETRVFNSLWLYRNRWFVLPEIPRDRLSKAKILRAFAPDDLVNGTVDEVATKIQQPEDFVHPVDDALFESLDRWRNEAFRHAPSAVGIDEQLHNLFVQLFVLRVVEDRGQLIGLARLEDALEGPDGVSRTRLEAIFREARERIQGELFERSAPADLPDFVLSGVIRDLYSPKHLPYESARYNFDWVDPDILGRAYEKYVSTVLSPVRVSSAQIRLFNEPHRDLQRVSKRKSYGIYYTPSYIARFLADAAVRKLNEETPITSKSLPRVIDIACGSGSFLAAAMDVIVKLLRQENPAKNWGRMIIEDQRIVGIDIDRRAVNIARLSLWLRLVQEPEPLPLPALERCIVAGDSLSEHVWKTLPAEYDIVLGNPPFLATGDVPTRDELSQKFKSAQGRFDYSSLFIEYSLRILRDGGTMGLVVPNRLFVNRDADVIRGLMTKHLQLVTVVDFGSLEVFIGTSAYIGLFVAIKTDGTDALPDARFIDVHAVPPRLAGAYLFDAASQTGPLATKYLESFNIPQPSADRAWTFLSPRARHLIAALSVSDARRLAEVADIFQGIKTGANDLLVVEKLAGTRGHLVQVQNALGEMAFLEQQLLMPVVFGSDIQRYVPMAPTKFLIYPYAKGQVLREEALDKEYPQTWEYLRFYESILKTRSSVAGGGLRWYELIRKRDESWLRAKKLLMRDLAPEPAFTLDDMGTTFLIGGTAVVPNDDGISEALLAFVNSTFVAWYLDQKTPSFRGGYKKFEVQHLTEIPVPGGFFEDATLDALGRLAREAASFHAAQPAGARSPAEAQIDEIIDGLLPAETEKSARIRSR